MSIRVLRMVWLALLVTPSAWGAEPGLEQAPPSMDLGLQAMRGILSPVLMAGCIADYEALGLPPAERKELQAKHFETEKRVVQLLAERQIARLELERMLSERSFDLTAAQKKVGEVSVVESKIRNAHVEYLFFMADRLDDGQWRQLLEQVNQHLSRQTGEEEVPCRDTTPPKGNPEGR